MSYETLIWCDLESTGLDPNVDVILEVAVIVTDAQGIPLTIYQAVVQPDNPDWKQSLDDVVLSMHTANGLIADIEAGRGKPLAVVDAHVAGILAQFPADRLLSGSGVARFDHLFIDRHMPRLGALLHYAEIDVGILRRAFEVMGRSDLAYVSSGPKTHRAYADIEDHLAEWRHYTKALAKP